MPKPKYLSVCSAIFKYRYLIFSTDKYILRITTCNKNINFSLNQFERFQTILIRIPIRHFTLIPLRIWIGTDLPV
jgi:hypothetical protein